MAHWEGNALMHNWYGSSQADEVGYLLANKDKRHPEPLVFVADTNDDIFVRRYYGEPSADEVLSAFLNWQRY